MGYIATPLHKLLIINDNLKEHYHQQLRRYE